MKSDPRLYKNKSVSELPRITKTIGILKSFYPSSLLDIGSGRGVFLYALMENFPNLNIKASDIEEKCVNDIKNYFELDTILCDAKDLPFEDNSFDVVTALECLEHMENYEEAIKEILRVAKNNVIISVPSKEDDNEGHINFLNKEEFIKILPNNKLKFEWVLGHMIVIIWK